jgi:hypothetical protein
MRARRAQSDALQRIGPVNRPFHPPAGRGGDLSLPNADQPSDPGPLNHRGSGECQLNPALKSRATTKLVDYATTRGARSWAVSLNMSRDTATSASPQTKHWRSPVLQSEENFFLSVNYLTPSQPILNDAA